MPYKDKKQRIANAIKWKKANPKKVRLSNEVYRQKNAISKEQKRAISLKSVYGIKIEDYNKIFSEQHGKCAICGKHQSELKKSFSIDHCHGSKKVRGLLCNNCNVAIGMFNDDIENLKCAILYLNKSRQPL